MAVQSRGKPLHWLGHWHCRVYLVPLVSLYDPRRRRRGGRGRDAPPRFRPAFVLRCSFFPFRRCCRFEPRLNPFFVLPCGGFCRSWLLEFLERDGLGVLLDSLERLGALGRRGGKSSMADLTSQVDCVACTRAVINSGVGLEYIVGHPAHTRQLATSELYSLHFRHGLFQLWPFLSK